MVEGSKARSNGGRIENALPQVWKLKGGGKIERFFWWPNSHGRPVHVEKFSKMIIFQKQFQCSPFQVGLPLDGFCSKKIFSNAKVIDQCFKLWIICMHLYLI